MGIGIRLDLTTSAGVLSRHAHAASGWTAFAPGWSDVPQRLLYVCVELSASGRLRNPGTLGL